MNHPIAKKGSLLKPDANAKLKLQIRPKKRIKKR